MGLRPVRGRVAVNEKARLTAAHVAALALELASWEGARIKAIHQDDTHVFRVVLDRPKQRADLVIDLDPALPHAYLAPAKVAPGEPSPLARVLRGTLQGGRLVDAAAVEGERVLLLRVRRTGEVATLAIELFGRQANWILVDPSGQVVATPRGGIATSRGQRVGDPYTPPEPDPERAAAQDPEPVAGISARIAALGAKVQGEATARERTRRLASCLGRLRKSLAKEARTLEGLRAQADEIEAWKERGELLRSAFHLLRPGLAAVVVPDYRTDPPTDVRIELDPRRAPGEQVGHCFERARKAERAVEEATRRTPALERHLEALGDLEAALAEAPDGSTLAPWLEGAPELLSKPVREALDPTPKKRGAPKAAKRSPWNTFTSLDGWPILVGRSARESDELTLRRSKGHDLFLHVRASPGAHVIVPTPRGKTVPRDTLLDAAELACLFSKRSEADRNEVDYVPRKYVRKRKGAPPGLVELTQHKTLSLQKDAGRRDRLLATKNRQDS